MVALNIITKQERTRLRDSILAASRQMPVKEVRELADALHGAARVRHDLEINSRKQRLPPEWQLIV